MGSPIRRPQVPADRAASVLSFLIPRRDEQRFLLAVGLCAAAALWLAIAWLEPLVLGALPLLGVVYIALLWAHRRFRRAGVDEDLQGVSGPLSSFWRREV